MTTEKNKPKTKFTLYVSELFYSIQGEGQTIGIPAVFLRLTGCNLNCTWCDSVEVWRKGNRIAFEDILNEELIDRLRDGAHLVITGGEPMLQAERVGNFIEWIAYTHGFMPIVEIETNGTIRPKSTLISLVTFWNVSPKLNNSGESYSDRVKEGPLREFNLLENTIFKFVIADTVQDIFDIETEYDFLNKDMFVLMPAGMNQEELQKTAPKVAEICKSLGVRYSPRVHIDIWNQKTGV